MGEKPFEGCAPTGAAKKPSRSQPHRNWLLVPSTPRSERPPGPRQSGKARRKHSAHRGTDYNGEVVSKEYIEERSGGFYISGTRVSLASVVHQFQQGAAPETILQDFPALISLENVYGAITYYLAHESAVDEYLRAQAQKWGDFSKTADPPPALGERVTGGPRHP